MVFSEEEKKLCANLVDVMNDLSGLLRKSGEDPYLYPGINKIKNIAKSCDPNGISKIPKYIEGLRDVISDNKAYSSVIGRKLEQAYGIAEQLVAAPGV